VSLNSEFTGSYKKSVFDKRKVENNAIDYRLPIDSSNPGYRLDVVAAVKLISSPTSA